MSSPNRLEEDVPVAVFHYGEKRKFLVKSSSYQDMIQTVKNKFELPLEKSLVLETSSLDICQGQNVEIDEAAYPLLYLALDVIKVVDIQAQDSSESNTRIRPPSPPKTPQPDEAETSAPPATSEERLKGNKRPLARFRQMVNSDKGKNVTRRNPAKPERQVIEGPIVESEEAQEAKDSHHASTSRHKADISIQMEQEPTEEESQLANESSAVPPDICNELDGLAGLLAGVNVKLKRLADVHVKKEIITPEDRGDITTHEVHEAPAESITVPRDQSDDDARFTISIKGPLPEHRAEFKTRGRHQIKKVLATACKTFGLDYTRAHLFLLLDAEDENGELYTHEFNCDLDETVVRSGVTKNSKMVVRVSATTSEDD